MIGLFDSGIGGLTVLKEMAKKLPGAALVYFGDTARTPYGNKSAEVVTQYGLEAAKFLVEHGAKAIVVACNTVSAVGLEAIKSAYPGVPVFNVITPVVTAVEKLTLKQRTVGVMGTRALVGSGIYQRLLQPGGYRVVAYAAPLLVPLVEEGWLDKPETKRIVKNYLAPFKRNQVEVLVLACTHYPLLKKIIAPRMGRRVKIVDPAEETAAVVAAWAAEHGESLAGESRFYVTDLTPHTQEIASKWLGRMVVLEKI